MNIDLILTEWCYRLPKGYPTSAKDYEVLYNVLLETADCTPENARQIVERAKGNIKDFIKESIDIGSIENQFLSKAVQEANKQNELVKFLSLLPVEAEMPTLKLLNSLSYDDSKQFASLLYSEIDRNPLFKGVAATEDRSNMNPTFVLVNPEHEALFDSMWKAAGISGLAGHRSVGGYRASMYNALPLESVQVLVDVMKELENKI